MNNAWKQLHPKDQFVVKIAAPLTSNDERTLSYLYQPIIGMDAFSVYHMFLTMIDTWEYDSQEMLHSDIMTQLDIGLPRFFEARNRLEGIGLLRVFLKQDNDTRQFLYMLLPPSCAENVFNDDVLSLLLLEKVGERQFDKLIQRFAVPKIDTTGFQETTKKFLDVYELNQEMLGSYEEKLSQAKEQFQPIDTPPVTTEDASFDWGYFMSLLDGLYLNKEQIESDAKSTIYTLHQLYGITELEMKKLVEEEMDYLTNQLDGNKLRLSVMKKYHQRKQRITEKEKVEGLTDSEQMIRRSNTLKLQGFSEEEIQVIVASETIAPMVFLESIKEQKGGFVAKEERWTVENLVKQSGLPDAVINVLIHYVLVGKGNASLGANFVNAIANDWGQSQIHSPEDAMKKVQEMVEQPAKKSYTKQTKYKKNYQGNARKESLPEWVGNPVKSETPVSKQKQLDFEERLKRLNNLGNGGES